jgi:hypothetical protein
MKNAANKRAPTLDWAKILDLTGAELLGVLFGGHRVYSIRNRMRIKWSIWDPSGEKLRYRFQDVRSFREAVQVVRQTDQPDCVEIDLLGRNAPGRPWKRELVPIRPNPKRFLFRLQPP